MLRALSEAKHMILSRTGVATPAQKDLPDFLGIGAPQCATTWLHANLKHHPEIYFPGGKELNYFDRHFWLPLSWYARAFRPGRGAVKGEVTAGYCALPDYAIEVLGQILPDVKLILVLRDPVERSWSAARRLLSFEVGDEIDEVTLGHVRELLRRKDLRRRSAYGSMLRRWLSVYPAEQILLLWYEEVAEAPETLLRRIFRHLGVDDTVDLSDFPTERRVNRNPRRPMPSQLRAELRRSLDDELDLFRQQLEVWPEGPLHPGPAPWL